jgi:hypothetical protein
MHPVIHVSKLWKYCYDPEITAAPPPPIVLEDEEHCRVAAVIGVKGKPPPRQFLVRWQGFAAMLITWKPEAEFDACRAKINEFHSTKDGAYRVMMCLASPTVSEVAAVAPCAGTSSQRPGVGFSGAGGSTHVKTSLWLAAMRNELLHPVASSSVVYTLHACIVRCMS